MIGDGETPEMKARNRKLRQAISMAIDWEEYAKVFPKKAGDTAMSPLPPGIYGSREGTLGGRQPGHAQGRWTARRCGVRSPMPSS